MALLTHRGVSVGVRLAECRAEGVLQGTVDTGNERFCRMTIVGRECGAKVGERVATSGLDGSFPAGLWLGVVASVKRAGEMQWELAVQPACNTNTIEFVQVLTGKLPEVPWPEVPQEKRSRRNGRG
jgi:rod shape-determining protein MreC